MRKEPLMNADKHRLNEGNSARAIGVHSRSSAVEDLNALTEKIIGCAYEVSNGLGAGFLEKVYENAMAMELRRAGLAVVRQHPVSVTYRSENVGDYYADLLVEGSVIVERKAVKALDDVHLAQCLNYLKAAGLSICLLVNFGRPRAEMRRVVRNF
jgi:GxxExxY protein